MNNNIFKGSPIKKCLWYKLEDRLWIKVREHEFFDNLSFKLWRKCRNRLILKQKFAKLLVEVDKNNEYKF